MADQASEVEALHARIHGLEEEIKRRIAEKQDVCAALGVDWRTVVNLGLEVTKRIAKGGPATPPDVADVLARIKHKVRSGAHALCLHCGFEGHVYGTPTSTLVTAPWCPHCERNDALIETVKPGSNREAQDD